MIELSALNIAALAIFAVCWIFYQPLLVLLGRRRSPAAAAIAILLKLLECLQTPAD